MLNELHWAWSAHWVSYWSAAYLFPRVVVKTTKPVSRQKLIITPIDPSERAVDNLLQNMLLTFTWSWFFVHMPAT